MTVRRPKETEALLRQALKYVESLADPGPDSSCALSPEVREAARIYINSWIAPPLAKALFNVCGDAAPAERHGYRLAHDGKSVW